jgi:hypothetical protein
MLMLVVRTVLFGPIGDVKIVMTVAPEAGPLNVESVVTPAEVQRCKNKDTKKIRMRVTCVMEKSFLNSNVGNPFKPAQTIGRAWSAGPK